MIRLSELYPDEFDVHFVDVKCTDLSHLPNLVNYTFDFIIFNTIMGIKDENPLLRYLEICLMKGAKVILDIDDYFEFGRSVIVSKDIGDKHAQLVPEAIREADYVTTTTGIYRKRLLELNPNVYVFPNFADSTDQQYIVNRKPICNSGGNSIIRIGVTGSVMHKHDMEILKGIPMLLKRDGLMPRIQFVLCGYHNNKWYCEYEKILTEDYRTVSRAYRQHLEDKSINSVWWDGQPYKRIPWKSTDEYMKVYNELDVLLAPLEDTKFNTYKSQIKYVEAGWMETLFIGSDVPAYYPYVKDGHNGFLCKNKNEFYRTIKHVVENWDKTSGFKKVIFNAKSDIIENYESEKITALRRAFFLNIKNE